MKLIGEQARENVITYGLGAIGLLKGLVVVYAIHPISDLLHEKLGAGGQTPERQPIPADVVSIGRTALHQEQQAA